MRQAIAKNNNEIAGLLTEDEKGEYIFTYDDQYTQETTNQFITFEMRVSKQSYRSRPYFHSLMD